MLILGLKDSEGLSEAERSLKNLKEGLNEDFPAGPLIKKCCTLDQVLTNVIAYVVLLFFNWFLFLFVILSTQKLWVWLYVSLFLGKRCHYLS